MSCTHSNGRIALSTALAAKVSSRSFSARHEAHRSLLFFLKRPVAMNTRDSTAPQRNKYAVAFLNRSARGDPAGRSDLHFTLATDSTLFSRCVEANGWTQAVGVFSVCCVWGAHGCGCRWGRRYSPQRTRRAHLLGLVWKLLLFVREMNQIQKV